MEAFAVELAQDGNGSGGHQGVAAAAAAAGLGTPAPLTEKPVCEQGGTAWVQGAAQLPGIGVEIGLAAEASQALADQGFILAEQTRCRPGGGWFGAGAGWGRLVEGGRLHQQLLGHQLHLLGRHGQVLQGAHQIVLEALDAPGHGIGLAGKAGFDLFLDLAAAGFQLADFLQQRLATLAQFSEGQVAPGLFGAGVVSHRDRNRNAPLR